MKNINTFDKFIKEQITNITTQPSDKPRGLYDNVLYKIKDLKRNLDNHTHGFSDEQISKIKGIFDRMPGYFTGEMDSWSSGGGIFHIGLVMDGGRIMMITNEFGDVLVSSKPVSWDEYHKYFNGDDWQMVTGETYGILNDDDIYTRISQDLRLKV